MTSEEKIFYLEGKIDALTHLCSYLLATHPISDKITNIFKNRASLELNRSGQSSDEQIFVKGYASILVNIDSARSVVRDAGLMASLPDDQSH
jgi:hypothetical protein